MIVNKKSWHYKLLNIGLYNNTAHPKTLCTYFWSVVLSLFLAPFVIVTALFLLIIVLITAIVIVLPYMGIGWYFRKCFGDVSKPQSINVATEWVKAKKRGNCQLIEYQD